MSHVTQFKNISEKPNFPQLEEEVLQFWEEIDAFQKQLEKSEGRKPYTFYDGPPFATGLPHYGHICAGTIKDVITRYASMTGHHVPRKFGWDCHGLPVEFEIDKTLGINTKEEREKFGLREYNEECRSIVMRYSGAWENIVTRMGRWIDFKDDYKTLDPSFMESVWWVFKTIYDNGHVYRGCKIMPYSNACNTALSNFEAQLNFKENVLDPAIFITFPMKEDESVSFIAWTTTPWTLPTNLVLCLNPNFVYVKFKDVESGKIYIVAECRLKALYGIKDENGQKKKKKKKKKKKNKKKKNDDTEVVEEEMKEGGEPKGDTLPFEVLETMKGADLEGKEYTPLFPYYEEMRANGCFRVVTDTYVEDSSGTGIVHCAPAYGEDDYRVCMKYKIINPEKPGVSVNENGLFIDKIEAYAGMYIKDADAQIMKDLKEQGRLFKKQQIRHSYPFCWRSDTPLIQKAVNQWFINVSEFKDKIIENNKKATWVPEPIQTGRFHNWLESANDWCFSRDRFWGNPIPIWISDDGQEIVVVGSIQELEELSGVTGITDIHRENIDHITIPSKQGKGDLKRIPEVFDCWFESGSMPYASVKYPHQLSKEDFATKFPADFIGEGLDQTRGWFYTLNVIATALFNDTPYKNLIVNGIVLAENGEKMSKSKKNYPDPMLVVNNYGADAVRLYLMNSPLVKADKLKFSEKGVHEVLKAVFIPWFNIARFLLQNIQRWEEQSGESFKFNEELFTDMSNFDNLMDKWILASNHELIAFVRQELDHYRLSTVLEKKLVFLEQLSNWYIKLNRDRLKGSVSPEDWLMSLNTLFYVLMNSMILMGPYVPFVVESFYQNMRLCLKEDSSLLEESIHFLLMPESNPALIDAELVSVVDKMQRIIQSARQCRENNDKPIKQGLLKLKVVCLDDATLQALQTVQEYIALEVNVEEIEFTSDYTKYIKYKLEPNHRLLGQKFKSEYGKIRPRLMKMTQEEIDEFIANKTITIEGNTYDEECFSLRADFIPIEEENQDIAGQLDFAIVLDLTVTPELLRRRYAREFINRVQKLRQAAKLNINDNILITFDFDDQSEENQVLQAVRENFAMIEERTKKRVMEYSTSTTLSIVASTEAEVQGQNFVIRISNNVLVPQQEKLAEDFPESAVLLAQVLGQYNANDETVSGAESLTLEVAGASVVLTKGVHYQTLY